MEHMQTLVWTACVEAMNNNTVKRILGHKIEEFDINEETKNKGRDFYCDFQTLLFKLAVERECMLHIQKTCLPLTPMEYCRAINKVLARSNEVGESYVKSMDKYQVCTIASVNRYYVQTTDN